MFWLLDEVKTNRKMVCITGCIGSGKTISMSVIAHMLNDLYLGAIYSNYGLKGSLPLEKASGNRSLKIICIDEVERVLQDSKEFIYDLIRDEDQQTIFIVTAYNENRIPETVRKHIDVSLDTMRLKDTILIKGINNSYDHEIFIKDYQNIYDALTPPRTNY